MKGVLFELLEMLCCILYHIALTLIGVFFCLSNENISKELFSFPGVLLIIAWEILGVILIMNFVQELIILRNHSNTSDQSDNDKN